MSSRSNNDCRSYDAAVIGFERSTKNERDVLREALTEYEAMRQMKHVRARNDNNRAANEWRQYQAEAILRQLGPE